MKSDYNPLARGIIKDIVGHLPAGPRNPDIFYTRAGEPVAAAVLLTFLMMKPEIVDHLNLQNVPFICADVHNLESEQIAENIEDNYPVTKIRDDVSIDEERNDKTLGLAHLNSSIVRVYRESNFSARESIINHAGGVAALMKMIFNDESSLHQEDGEPSADGVTQVAEEDDLYVSFDDFPMRLCLDEVLDAQDDPEKLKLFMQRMQSEKGAGSLHEVPITLCHEISHLRGIEREIVAAGAAEDIDIAAYNESAKEKVPENFIHINPGRYAQKLFCSEVLAVERKAVQQSGTKETKGLSYFLKSDEETMAQLLGEAILDDIARRSGLEMYSCGLSKVMPQSAVYFGRWVNRMQPVDGLDTPMDICPDRQMMPRSEWAAEDFDDFDFK